MRDSRSRTQTFLAIGRKDLIALAKLVRPAGISRQASPRENSTIREILIPVLIALIGAGIGTLGTGVLVEAYKAEDQMRKYILIDMYKPLRDSSSECLVKRQELVTAFSSLLMTLGPVVELLKDAEKNPKRLEQIALSNPAKAFESFSKDASEIGSKRAQVERCVRSIALRNEELAAVLGKRSELEALITKWNKEMGPAPSPELKKNSKFLEYLTEPAKMYGLIKAIEGAADGDALKAQAVLVRLRVVAEEMMDYARSEMTVNLAMRNRDEDFLHKAHVLFLEEISARYGRGPIDVALREIKPR